MGTSKVNGEKLLDSKIDKARKIPTFGKQHQQKYSVINPWN